MKTYKVLFSHNYSKGSVGIRTEKSQKLVKKFFNEFLNLYQNSESIPLNTVIKKFKQLMPETVYLDIGKLPECEYDNCGASIISYINNNGDIIRYKLLVPTESNKLHLESLPNLMHESTHLFDSLLTPKTSKTIKKIASNENLDKPLELFDKYYYIGNHELLDKNTKIKNVKKQTLKSIKNLSAKEKLTILNYFKDSMQTELNAYRMEDYCNKKLESIGKAGNYYTFKEMDDTYHFKEKIDMLNKMIYKIISKERYQLALKNTVSPMDKLKITFDYCLKSLI